MAPYNQVNQAYRPSRPNQPVFAVRPNPVYNQGNQQMNINKPVQPQQPQAIQKQSQGPQKRALQNLQITLPPPPTQTTSTTQQTTQQTSGPRPIEGGMNVGYQQQQYRFGFAENPAVGAEPGQYRYLEEEEEEELKRRALTSPYPGQLPSPYPGQLPSPYPGQYPVQLPNPYPQTNQQQKQMSELDTLVKSGLQKACDLSSTSVFDKKKYPWIVSIGTNSEKHVKTGVLIHPRWVLTVQDYMNISLKNYIVKIGGVNLDNNSEFAIHSVINDVIHPDNRIQLLQLNTDVVGIKPIKINTQNTIKSPAIEIGWGTLSGSSKTFTLHEMNMPILNSEICKVVFKEKFNDNMNICGGYPECSNLIPCIGDTGDPLIFLNENNEYILEGISEYHLNCEVRSGLASWIKIKKLIPWILQYIPDLYAPTTMSPTLPPTTYTLPPTTYTLPPTTLPPTTLTPTTQAPVVLGAEALDKLLSYITNKNTQKNAITPSPPIYRNIVPNETKSSFTMPKFNFDSRYIVLTFIIILFTLFFIVMIMNITK